MSWIDDAQDWLPEAQTLDEDRRRIDQALAVPHSPLVEAALLEERRWLRQRQRRFLRHPVDCEARLDVAEGTHLVRVRDISEGGALLELDRPLEPGARAQLRLPQLPDRPTAWCVVRHASLETRRVGVQFEGDPAVAALLAAELVRLYGEGGSGEGG
jgi:PilZ domain